MTGKNPGKHGVFHFIETAPDSYAMNYANGGSRRSPTVWKILNAAGFSVGTMNIPFTYPPEALDGFQISGLDTPSATSQFVYPASLKRELVDHLGKINHDLRFLGNMSTDHRRGQVLAEMERVDQQWAAVALYLLEHHPQDVMMFVFMSIDTVQHYFWQYMDRSHFLRPEGRASFWKCSASGVRTTRRRDRPDNREASQRYDRLGCLRPRRWPGGRS